MLGHLPAVIKNRLRLHDWRLEQLRAHNGGSHNGTVAMARPMTADKMMFLTTDPTYVPSLPAPPPLSLPPPSPPFPVSCEWGDLRRCWPGYVYVGLRVPASVLCVFLFLSFPSFSFFLFSTTFLSGNSLRIRPLSQQSRITFAASSSTS